MREKERKKEQRKKNRERERREERRKKRKKKRPKLQMSSAHFRISNFSKFSSVLETNPPAGKTRAPNQYKLQTTQQIGRAHV